MSLVLENNNNELDYDRGQLLSLKTYANYNLAKLRMITEEHTEENLKDILNLLEDTPYVCVDQSKNRELREEIRSML